jgi:hypothetical protein
MSPKNQENRCQFTSPRGRRCKLPRAAKHDSLCLHHAHHEEKRTDQFPCTPEAKALVAEVLGSPRDFRTVTSVNAFIANLVSLRARKLLNARDASYFAYLAQLLLISLPGLKSEFISVNDLNAWDEIVNTALRSSTSESEPAPSKSRPRKKRRLKMPRTRREFAEQVFARIGIDPRTQEQFARALAQEESPNEESPETEPPETDQDDQEDAAPQYADPNTM